jgi:alkylation response protein AidB-like acyl-CoA dehydrogenase
VQREPAAPPRRDCWDEGDDMDFEHTEQEQRFRQEVRAFLNEIWPESERKHGNEDRNAPEFQERSDRFRAAVAQKGWFTLGLPAEYGGLPNFSQMERWIVSDECSRIGAPLPPYLVSIMGPIIVKYGTPWMKTEVLPRIKAGETDFVFGFTEPETGSDLANLQTRAVRDGDEYVINGSKMYGHPGPGDIMFLAVRTDPNAPIRKGISVIFVEHGREGFQVANMPTLAGGHVGATFYDNVRVPADHLLGEENKGWDYVREALDLDRTSGITYGYLPLRIRELIDHIKASTMNGKPLTEDPWVRDRLAQLVVELEAGEILQQMTASKIATGMKLRSESSVVKVFLSEFGRRLGEFGMEVAGPLAPLTAESPDAPYDGEINALWSSNVAGTIAGGSSEIQRNIIALQGLGLPRD